MEITFEHIKCPLNRYTFQVKSMRKWVEKMCIGRTLNLFAGKTALDINEIRNDIDTEMTADFHLDALQFVKTYVGEPFDTILLDPPYSYRKSMEMYKGNVVSPFLKLKDAIPEIINKSGRVITFGYHSVSMGKKRGFSVSNIAIFSHGGAIHDTIATVEVFNIINFL